MEKWNRIYRGQVQGEVVVLSKSVRLPEGTEVLVEPIVQQLSPTLSVGFITRNGVPVFPKAETESAPSLNLVNAFRDDVP